MTREVFVAGGTPKQTYNPRQASRIEQELDRYLEGSGKALTIYGPSKSGKTSLVERKLPKENHIWVQGQDIQTLEDFWKQIAAQIRVANSEIEGASKERGTEESIGGGIGIPKIIHAETSSKDVERSSEKAESTFEIHLAEKVRKSLSKNKYPVIVDDFHYIPDGVKKSISRAIKSIIRDSPLILIAVPSEAFEVVSSEPEMNLRVWSVPIPHWEEEELRQIAIRGFELLNIDDSVNNIASLLASYSYSSPYIMQQLCLDLIRWEHQIEETLSAEKPLSLAGPSDLKTFLSESAERARWGILPKLLAGPAGSNRVDLTIRDGHTNTDIYGAVLVALKNLTPPLNHTEREVYQEVNRICTKSVQTVQVSNALEGMHKIADREKGDSDPVLRRRDKMVFIEDSGFAFYLNHGSWSPLKKSNGSNP
ncbi:ATP-binding protein [Rhodococcus sp. MS13]|uniref:ATP-binding protein n=1 Tax=Rhodococcus sp. MS13 TaxID=2579940 RepID=UPI0015628916|nr:ATP-binding protein [Rhodococcus sp. MS13]NRH34931.1 ATP-binding protein [Rhodococcus sp. MS13]